MAVVWYLGHAQLMTGTIALVMMASMAYLLHCRPFAEPSDIYIEIFNDFTAYVVMVVLRVFNQQHKDDFTAADSETEEVKVDVVDNFLTPTERVNIAWGIITLLLIYIVLHMTFFTRAIIISLVAGCKARCEKEQKLKGNKTKSEED